MRSRFVPDSVCLLHIWQVYVGIQQTRNKVVFAAFEYYAKVRMALFGKVISRVSKFRENPSVRHNVSKCRENPSVRHNAVQTDIWLVQCIQRAPSILEKHTPRCQALYINALT